MGQLTPWCPCDHPRGFPLASSACDWCVEGTWHPANGLLELQKEPLLLKEAYEMVKHWESYILRTFYPSLYTALSFISSPDQPCPACREYHTASKSLRGLWELTVHQAEKANLLYPNLSAFFTYRSSKERQIGIDVSTCITTQVVPSPPWVSSNMMLLMVLVKPAHGAVSS